MTRLSAIRAITGRVGLLQSDGKIGSHTTRTVSLPDSRLSTSSAAEAPRKQPGHVGDNRRTMRTFDTARLNWLRNRLSLVRRVSGGWPLGVIGDHKKYQATVSAASPRSPQSHFFFVIPDTSIRRRGWRPVEETGPPESRSPQQSRKARD